MRSYLLIAEIKDEIFVDIRGGSLRDLLKKKMNKSDNEILISIELDDLADFISANDCSNYSLIHVREVGKSSLSQKVRDLAGENGFSVFNNRNKELISKSVKSSEVFREKYVSGNWNPVAE